MSAQPVIQKQPLPPQGLYVKWFVQTNYCQTLPQANHDWLESSKSQNGFAASRRTVLSTLEWVDMRPSPTL